MRALVDDVVVVGGLVPQDQRLDVAPLRCHSCRQMEKQKAHYLLVDIKAAFDTTTGLRLTVSARRYAFGLGMSLQDVVDLVQGVAPSQFYKSMTSIADHTVWQDVYHVPFDADLTLYVKFTVDPDGFLLISLKEK